MSKRMATLKKAVILLSMGGATFCLGGFGGFGGFGNDLGCVRNANLVDFYQGVGNAGIESFADSTRVAMGYDTDFDEWVITPTQGFFTAMWDNWTAQQFPLDVEPITANVLKQ